MFQQPKEVLLWLVWVLTYSIGWAICFLLLATSAFATIDYDSTTKSVFPTNLLDFGVFHATIWGGISTFQWIVLRAGYFPWVVWWSPWWILTNIVGWVTFWLCAYTVPLPVSTLSLFAACLPASFGIGILEWLVLRHYISQSTLWLGVHPLAFTGALLIQWITSVIHIQTFGGVGTSLILLLDILLPGVVYGGSLGLAAVFLLRKCRCCQSNSTL
ncbi:MAG: hypothetical protein GFH27_549311n183 [Chloroflexi bacterium AL-W]|nr:hypothetical protein [Chloroflexi bacterium AL-N1]NOK68639.1 hypothetical protein [Chloroflexi bacterium AL-N10]NOK76125.1 hypothetical protein [Chloroflexi bacterium AL-N5]NOK84238.1 hypothetical protein [Chloroflexi bacterium AL-W]NOK91263.1 hypothetical protein [Chloroflexi bacterium AL-N15]